MTVARADADLIDFSDIATGERLTPVTPGDVLRAEFMAALGLSARTLAHELKVPPKRITGVLNGTRAVTAETALLLARHFGISAEFWMNLRTSHDLEHAWKAIEQAA